MNKTSYSLRHAICFATVLGIALACAGCASDQTSLPVIASLSPSSMTAGGQGFTLKVTGTGFQSTDVVLWNGKALATQPVGSTELDAVVPATLITGAAVTIPNQASRMVSRLRAQTTASTSPITITISVFQKPPGSLTSNGMPFTINPSGPSQAPNLSVTKTHTGNFTQGQTGATYSITVGNTGTAPTSGTVTVTDTPPAGLTATAASGRGWTCTISVTCTRSDALATGASYPAITLTVNVAANAPSSVTNSATASGGGAQPVTASDPTTVIAPQTPALTITKTHTGNASQGQTGFTFTIVVGNSGSGTTSGPVTVTENPSAGITITVMSGPGWTCTITNCNRPDALAPGSNYPSITVTATFAANASATETNTVTVSGGGAASSTSASDTVTVTSSALKVKFTQITTGDKDSFTLSVNFDPYIAFTSSATNLVTGDTNANPDVFVACVAAGATTSCPTPIERVSLNSSGGQIAGGTILDVALNGSSASPISKDGRFIVFVSIDPNVATPATPVGVTEIYLRDTCLGATACTPATTLVSASALGVAAAQFSNTPSMSASGRVIAFTSADFNLAPPASGQQVYARDTCFGAPAGCTIKNVLVSADNSGIKGNLPSSNASTSDDGRFVAFSSSANSLVPTTGAIAMDIFLRDTCIGATGTCSPTTTLVSANKSGVPGNSFSQNPSISGDGRFVVFASASSDLVPGGNTALGRPDIFLRDTCGGASGPVTGCTPTTSRISQALSGTLPDNASITSSTGRSISANGRFVAFASLATNLLPTPSTSGQVYVLDTCFGAPAGCQQALHKVSVDASGNELESNATATEYALSGDGHSIAFTALTGTAPNQIAQVFIAPTGF